MSRWTRRHTHAIIVYTNSRTYNAFHTQERAEYISRCLVDGTPLFAIVDGNQRVACGLLLALDPSKPLVTLDTPIDVDPLEPHTPPALCVAAALLLNRRA